MDGFKGVNCANAINKVKLLAAKIRRDVVMMIGCGGQTGHLGGSCSSADIVAVLYCHKMKIDPKNPGWESRDKFIYSKGHAAIAQYAALAEVGYFEVQELFEAKKLGSMLQGHPDRLKTPGIEAGTGSLGQGLSIANGLALAMKLENKTNKVYCVLGDGEMNEGQIWEAAAAACNFKLGNVTAIVDLNRMQATGATDERFRFGSVQEKWESFGWSVNVINGHDIKEIMKALDDADEACDIPQAIIARTVKGKGISFAENMAGFHNSALTKEQYGMALKELDGEIARLCKKNTEDGDDYYE